LSPLFSFNKSSKRPTKGAKDLDPILIERSYYVAPDTKRGAIDKAYSLLVRILSETNKIAIGKVVFKDKEPGKS
jgi:non-homologous end joining protein Ku